MSRPAVAEPGSRAARTLGDRRSVPDVRWIARLTGAAPADVKRTLREVDDLLEIERTIRLAHAEGGRRFYAQFRAPFDIYALVRLRRPAEVVETGVSSGVSSAHFLLGLRANESGRLHSVDLPTRQRGATLAASESPVSLPPGRQPGWAVPAELSRGWDLRLGPSERLLPGLVSELDEVSIFLHDSHHTPKHLTFELETVRPWLRPGAIVMADNTQWTGNAFDRFAASLEAPVVRRRRSDLVGLRVPDSAE
ncbi:MAG TPA: class I SAM-dependent methyltransferase [Thermoplasmata archaeon]|nr:class I SAM-dependent methyltransferase [Thermoplasmata archaeon]